MIDRDKEFLGKQRSQLDNLYEMRNNAKGDKFRDQVAGWIQEQEEKIASVERQIDEKREKIADINQKL